MTKSVLVVTLGTTWQVVPELLGFTNPNLPFYKKHPDVEEFKRMARKEYLIKPITEIWAITTDGNLTDESIKKLKTWIQNYNFQNYNFKLEIYKLDNIEELATVTECEKMANLIYKVVLKASEYADHLYLSLAGGRKTMSADMQQAGNLFGCDAMLHVVNTYLKDKDEREKFNNLKFDSEIEENLIKSITPFVIFGKLNKQTILNVNTKIESINYPIDNKNDIELYKEIQQRLKDARSLLFNYSLQSIGNNQSTNFRALYSLMPDSIGKIKETIPNLKILKKLPKAELHCHFGGIANTSELIEIAKSNYKEIEFFKQKVKEFEEWLFGIKDLADNKDLEGLKKSVTDVKAIRNKFDSVKEPYAVAGFILQFEDNTELLDEYIYGDYLSEDKFVGINIDNYERLGDLQGSGILQSEKSIRKACEILGNQCREHNIKYIEVRCSPINYSRGDLQPEEVIKIMMEEFKKIKETYFNILFIASRHRNLETIEKHIDLADKMYDEVEDFKNFFAGFDLAGNESAKTPQELRELFLKIMEKSGSITIHAGETRDAENIWEAVYHLNADRIGHGLTLNEKPNLLKKIRDRKIAIEMCPSSNHQIVGFNSSKTYPLREYLKEGLKVTINTDNPGISRTNFTKEYIKAIELTNNNLNLWEILQIIKNSFKVAFLTFEKKQKFILEAEKEIIKTLEDLIL